MESGVQSSFIPHEAVTSSMSPQRSNGGLASFGLLVAIVLFVASIALAGAVFLYQQYLQTQISSKTNQLKQAEASFDPSLIEQLTRLDDRMQVADQLLASHLAPSLFFQALNQATLTTVSFKNLTIESSDPREITLKMQGLAKSVNSIALQADIFSKSGIITSPIFSNIDREQDGVHFDVTAIINPSALGFTQFLSGTSQAPASQPASGAPQETSPFAPNQGTPAQ